MDFMADGGPKHLNTIQLESYNLFVISQSDRVSWPQT